MRKGKSGVHVSRLARNIADQYPFEPEIAAVVETVANALDAKASRIEISFDKAAGTLTVDDNGVGMSKSKFQDYHDFASSTKQRGTGIGFAGQGAKLALNFCSEVITETWSADYRGYSNWRLEGDEAPWEIFDDGVQQLDHCGTRVTLLLHDAAKRFYSEERIGEMLREHYYPLVDSGLVGKAYEALYKGGIEFFINGKRVTAPSFDLNVERTKQTAVTIYRKPKAIVMFGLWKGSDAPYPGVAVCTYGKVVERTYFKKEPREPGRIVGWIEAPYLIKAVTTDKCRFQRGNQVWEGFFRKAQAEFANWLEQVGLADQVTRRTADFGGLEREINRILRNMPELPFFGARTSAEVAIPGENGAGRVPTEGVQLVRGGEPGSSGGSGVPVPGEDQPGQALTTHEGQGPPGTVTKRTIRGGIQLGEDDRPDLEMEAWFDGTTVMVNKAHSAYRRAEREKHVNYHIVKCVCMELIKFALDKEETPSHSRVFELAGRFFGAWGRA